MTDYLTTQAQLPQPIPDVLPERDLEIDPVRTRVEINAALALRCADLSRESETNRRRWQDAAARHDAERERRHTAESSTRGRIFSALSAERDRQDAKWGPVRMHPNVDPALAARGAGHQRICEEHEIPTANRAKQLCELARSRGEISWTAILVEEVCEAIEVHDDPVKLREELVQVGAVVVKWLEALDMEERAGC